MKLYIDGNVNRYYVQNLCMIFFPGVKFAEDEEITEDTPIVSVTVCCDDEGAHAEAEIRIGDKSKCGSYTELRRDDFTEERMIKLAVGAAVFDAGRQFFGVRPSWGMVTGVRPAKIAAEMLAAGKGVTEIKEILRNHYFMNPKKAALLTDIARREAKIVKNLGDNTCSVYISIPFCPTRCAYCSFVSYSTNRLLSLIPEYLDRLILDIDRLFETIRACGVRPVTVYIGGGTPTTLNEAQLERLLDAVCRNVDVSTLMEFTLEAGRPDTVTAAKLASAKAHGVTRVSINTQTLNNEVLERIGRRHTAEDYYKAFELARAAEIPIINTDLIAGLPGEDFASFSRTMDAIINLRPENITVHTFCVKKSADIIKSGTDIYSRSGGETGKSIDYSQVKAKLAGYKPYYCYKQRNSIGNFENVGFSLEGTEGLYNIFMMEEVHHIFAAGAGSVTKLVSKSPAKINRIFMPKYPYEYLAMEKEPEKMENYYKEILDYFNVQ